MRPDSLTFPAPVGGAEKSSFSAQIHNLRPNNPIIRYRKSGQGGRGRGWVPFWGHFWVKFGGQKVARNRQKWPKVAKMAKNGQKWPKMAFLGGPWVNPHPPPFCGSKHAWKPRFSPKGPFSRIFGLGGSAGGSKMAKNGQKWQILVKFLIKKRGQKGGQKGGQIWGVILGSFLGFHDCAR